MNALTRAERAGLEAPTVNFTLDGREVAARADESILQAAQRVGVEIPHLCWNEGLEPAGNCRACMVEVKGERTLAASCCRRPTAGMEVKSTSERARSAQKLVLELLQSDLPEQAHTRDNEVDAWAAKLGVGKPRFAPRAAVAADLSHPAIAVNLDACIQCTRCLRACRDEQANDVIGLAFRGEHAKIVFDFDDAMGASSCVACGECVQACPTGALSPARGAALAVPDQSVDSVCPYCGVGCQLTYHVKDDQIIYVEGRDGPANRGRLCVKGRYGFDYARHPHRLTVPLVRRADAPKRADAISDPAVARGYFREATWEEALAHAGGALRRIRDDHGARALAGFGSAKGSNEEAYLFQKLVRLGFGSNNVDHCTRLCHASSVAALLEGIGSGAVSNPVLDVAAAEVVIVIGANPVVNHPVAASWIKNAVRRGTQLILMDPRRSELARHAHRYLPFKPDSDVALLNSMMHVIVEEGLVAPEFIASRTEGYEALAANVRGYSPEAMAPVTGIDADTLREVARLYASSRASMILWGMGVSQHVHGTDNARCLIALALMTGQIGRPGTGLHPLRGQNNVQGASDAGLIPMMYPDYQRVGEPAARERIAAAWGVPVQQLDQNPGLTVVEVMNAILAGSVKGMVVMGENPAMSDPDAGHAREALAALEMLVVQDIFLTETACLADVVLPASVFVEKTGSFTNTDRLVQLGRRALGLPGQARQDLWILTALAEQLGLDWSAYGATPADCDAAAGRVFEEMRGVMPSIAGISWARLQREGSVTYPCEHEGDPGQPVVFTERFPTTSGRARFVPADIVPADERPDTDYPLVLITGRQLEHWHTGSMTRRSGVLDALEPDPVVLLHPLQLARLGVAPGALVTLESRRGTVSLYARADEGMPQDAVFVAFCWFEAAVNKLTNPALDPVAKIPEFKYCAVRLRAGGELPAAATFGGGQLLPAHG
ncbi:tungsten-containing formate dehydrogenase alpha subunit [Rubrivivax sp. A210]|uniref:formate dehydrogenase subunit alpha n=1 Tax=Rubrivivax sp. A210 TaxID=2772301 RepID=UPI00191AA112|nr:formate dehydrogenase subunit alpha [Rubrivivax sp. A210]CAD5373794.1 tungsten-containing formate dehydrogenase alpha subunit [Rubrivivax sp. A210]